MSEVNRRQALAVLAVATTIRWGVSAMQAPPRVRSGALITLYRTDADAFRLEAPGRKTVDVPATAGRLRFRAPAGPMAHLETLQCTPLIDGQPTEKSVVVEVFTPKPLYGA